MVAIVEKCQSDVYMIKCTWYQTGEWTHDVHLLDYLAWRKMYTLWWTNNPMQWGEVRLDRQEKKKLCRKDLFMHSKQHPQLWKDNPVADGMHICVYRNAHKGWKNVNDGSRLIHRTLFCECARIGWQKHVLGSSSAQSRYNRMYIKSVYIHSHTLPCGTHRVGVESKLARNQRAQVALFGAISLDRVILCLHYMQRQL